MSSRIESTMNLKLNNDVKGSVHTLKTPASIIKEERRRTGRYIAILVGILLFILALYHAWVRRIPVVASLVVPALIMFVYVAWVLYTASRDKHRLLDMEAALNAQNEDCEEVNVEVTQNLEVSVISSKDSSNVNSPDGSVQNWTEIPAAFLKREKNIRTEAENNCFTLPIILVNDKPPEDLDQKWLHIVEKVSNEKIKGNTTKRKFKRKFCRRRHNVFKRSYSIG